MGALSPTVCQQPLIESLQVFPLHADMQQRQRLKNMDRFSREENIVLIASVNSCCLRTMHPAAVSVLSILSLSRCSLSQLQAKQVDSPTTVVCHDFPALFLVI